MGYTTDGMRSIYDDNPKPRRREGWPEARRTDVPKRRSDRGERARRIIVLFVAALGLCVLTAAILFWISSGLGAP